MLLPSIFTGYKGNDDDERDADGESAGRASKRDLHNERKACWASRSQFAGWTNGGVFLRTAIGNPMFR